VINFLVNNKEIDEEMLIEGVAGDYLSRSQSSSEILSEEEKDIYNGIHDEYDELTSGYSTISSN